MGSECEMLRFDMGVEFVLSFYLFVLPVMNYFCKLDC